MLFFFTGIGKLSAGDGKHLADPEVLRRLTSSVSCALDEAAAALTRMRSDNPRQQTETRYHLIISYLYTLIIIHLLLYTHTFFQLSFYKFTGPFKKMKTFLLTNLYFHILKIDSCNKLQPINFLHLIFFQIYAHKCVFIVFTFIVSLKFF